MIIEDRIWGSFKIDDKFVPIIESNEFLKLKNKRQNGIYNKQEYVHTRYEHSLGVYFLSSKLITIIEKKLNNCINITEQEKDAIKIMALCHDIGHGPFSHLAERCLEGTHEENTVRILTGDSDINKVIIENFGQETLDKVIDLVQLKEKIKTNNVYNENIDLIFVVSKLLSGGIDVDRLDYIARDSFHITGKKEDFSKLLDYINLDYINDYLEITFDSDAEYLIANYLNKRFEQYDKIYLSDRKIIIENIFKKYIAKIKYPLTWDTEENDILDDMKNKLENSDYIIKRYLQIILGKEIDQDIVYRVFNSKQEYDYFTDYLKSNFSFLNESESFINISDKMSIYSSKNRIFINHNGVIKEMSDCKILNSNLCEEKYIVGIDFGILNRELNLEKDIYETLKSKFELDIEQEKKYTFLVDNDDDFNKQVELIIKDLNVKVGKATYNLDLYYTSDDNCLSRKRVTVRNRRTKNKNIWNVKIPLDDKSSITKRIEKNLSSKNESVAYLKSIGFNIMGLKPYINLNTDRQTAIFQFRNSLFEFAFDRTVANKEEENINPYYMLECELKKGDSIDLYFLNQLLKKYPFLKECNNSKLEIAESKFEQISKEKTLILK
jgi:HD superfamily phosphohydrolase